MVGVTVEVGVLVCERIISVGVGVTVGVGV